MIASIFKRFADNDTFYNPVATPDSGLLSVKEHIKGKAFPFLASVSLTALSLGLSAAAVGPAAAVGVAAGLTALSVVFTARSFGKIAKRLEEVASYDFTQLDDALRFARRFPEQAGLPAKFLRVAAAAGVPEEKIPRIYVTSSSDDFWVTRLKPFSREEHYAMVVGRKRFQKDNTESLLSGMAHEMGHTALGHSGTASLAFHVKTLPLLNLQAGVALALTGNIMAGAAYTVAAYALNVITLAKRSQYNEREADRFSLKTTGIIDAAAEEFDWDYDFEKRSKASSTTRKLLSTHPPAGQRADYIRDFGKANPDFCAKRRAALGFSC